MGQGGTPIVKCLVIHGLTEKKKQRQYQSGGQGTKEEETVWKTKHFTMRKRPERGGFRVRETWVVVIFFSKMDVQGAPLKLNLRAI